MKPQWTLPPALANLALDAIVRRQFETSWGKARAWIETGKVFVDDRVALDPRSFPPVGAKIELRMNAPRASVGAKRGQGTTISARVPTLDPSRVIHCDSQLVVLDKPAGISTAPNDAGAPEPDGTLIDSVRDRLGGGRLEVVHRLDKETSGLIVFARTREAAQALGNQFRFHTVHRRYLAWVHGRVEGGPGRTIRSTFVLDRGDGLRGSARPGWRLAPGEGREAVTHVRVLERRDDRTLIECRLETGRTHQIRIHLSEAGHPLVGEKLYIRDYRGPRIESPRVLLHAAELGLKHPGSGAELRWESALPVEFGLTRFTTQGV